MASKPIKVGFIGLSASGWAASSTGPALLSPSLKEVYTLVAISTSTPESAETAAEKYSKLTGSTVKGYHGSSASIAEDEDVDLVAISVKAPLHRDILLPVIERGKDFFIEWPAGRNSGETEEIRREAKKKGVRAWVGLQARVSPVVLKVKELIDSGIIGKVHSSTYIAVVPSDGHLWAPTPPQSLRYSLDVSNGVTPLAVGIGHQLDAITSVLGLHTSVTASATQTYPILRLIDTELGGKETGETFQSQSNDHFTFSGELDSGVYSTFSMKFGGKSFKGRKTLQWEIEGEDGHIRVESELLMGGCINLVSPDLYVNGEKVEVGGVRSGTYDTVPILEAQWREYARGEKMGRYATIDDAVRNHRILDAVEKSIREGRKVFVDFTM